MAKWFYSKGNETQGPYSSEQVKELAAKGLLHPSDMIWPEGGDRKDAIAAEGVVDFANLLMGRAAVPDWLEDVAKAETKGPVPTLAYDGEVPEWLEDVRLWYGLEALSIGFAVTVASPAHALDTPKSQTVVIQSADAAPIGAIPTTPGQPPSSQIPVTGSSHSAKKIPLSTKPIGRPAQTSLHLEDDSLVEKAMNETGFDFRTGQVLDVAKFEKWKHQRAAASGATSSQTNASVMEVFRKARVAIEHWIDDDNQRSLILDAKLDDILKTPELVGILKRFAHHGPIMNDKLLKHLAFMVENRKSYYAAVARG